jgi:ribosomal protein S18 acetylase RimI-like enzyme
MPFLQHTNLPRQAQDKADRAYGQPKEWSGFCRLGADSFLTVNPKNQAAINLYISWGFEVTEESLVKGYYEAAESGDRLVIVRPQGAERKVAETPRL